MFVCDGVDAFCCIKRKLIKLLQDLKNEMKIDEETYKKLYPTAEGLPLLYCTPKIHKKNIPLRPIVDCTGAVTYQTSKFIVTLLRSLVGKTPQHCKNSQELAKELASVTVEKDEELISNDVVSLFTKTPVSPTLDITRKRLQKDKGLRKRTKLSVEDIMNLLVFTTKNTYFQFNGKIYRQKEGFAMGDPLSAVMANLFMEDLEQQALDTAPVECAISLWKRYVDDIINKIKRGQAQKLNDHLNQIDPTGNIKFTHERATEIIKMKEILSELPFLDIKLIVNPDGSIRLQIYRKTTHTDQYLMFDSHHPVQHKLSVVRTLLSRKDEIVTTPEDRKTEEAHVKQALKACKYPEWAITKVEKQLAERKSQPKTKSKTERKTEAKKKGMVVLPYVCGVTEKIQRSMKKHGIEAPSKPHRTMRQILVHPKDKIDDGKKCGAVYCVPCLSCPQKYIGETGRKLETRIEDHKKETEQVQARRKTRSVTTQEDNTKRKSAICEHAREMNHVMNWDDVKILERESDKYTRWIRESVQVRMLDKDIPMNRDEGNYKLPHVWDTLLASKPSKPPGRPSLCS